MDKEADFWCYTLIVFSAGLAAGCVLCRVLVDHGML